MIQTENGDLSFLILQPLTYMCLICNWLTVIFKLAFVAFITASNFAQPCVCNVVHLHDHVFLMTGGMKRVKTKFVAT